MTTVDPIMSCDFATGLGQARKGRYLLHPAPSPHPPFQLILLQGTLGVTTFLVLRLFPWRNSAIESLVVKYAGSYSFLGNLLFSFVNLFFFCSRRAYFCIYQYIFPSIHTSVPLVPLIFFLTYQSVDTFDTFGPLCFVGFFLFFFPPVILWSLH